MKVLKKIWVPVLIAIILIAFGGAVYYQKAVVPKKEIDKKAGITSGKLDDYITLGEYKGLSCEVTQDDIDESIKEETQTYTEVDREAKEGDCVEITFCLEPQYVPDNINNDKFESAKLKPDEEYNMNIKLKFL